MKSLQFQKKNAEYNQYVLQEFDEIFQAVPCPYLSRTTLTRKEYEKKYGNMHRTPLWNQVVKRYHNCTGDPLSKSDDFLRVMDIFMRFWEEDPETDSDD